MQSDHGHFDLLLTACSDVCFIGYQPCKAADACCDVKGQFVRLGSVTREDDDDDDDDVGGQEFCCCDRRESR